MPDVNDLHKRFRNRDDFALITVCMDHPSQYKDTRALIRQHGIRYPILRSPTAVKRADGCGWYPGSFSVPTAFLIDPQGTIFDKVWIGDKLIAELDFLLDHDDPLPPLGMDVSDRPNADGGIIATLQLYNPQHTPLDIEVWAGTTVAIYDDEGNLVDYEFPDVWEDGQEPVVRAVFDEFGDFTYELAFPFKDGAVNISYGFSVVYPGTETLFDDEGLTIGTSSYSSINRGQD